MSKYDYDLIVIGAGSAGVRAARLAAQKGKKVAIAEGYRIGGTCVIRGCVPKKMMVYAAQTGLKLKQINGSGWQSSDLKFNWNTLRATLENEVERLSSIYQKNLESAGVELINEYLSFKTEHKLYGQKSHCIYSATHILIATGGTPFLPDIPGIDLTITTDQVFSLREFPEKVIILGGGYIAIEFAGIFKGLGVETSLVYRGDRLLRGFDRDLSLYVEENLNALGVKLYLNTDLEKVEKAKTGLTSYFKRQEDQSSILLQTDCILTALGRNPKTDQLGLENIGLPNKGAIKVDSYSKTALDYIYAVGDVTNRLNLTPVAIRESVAFIKTVFENTPTKFTYDHIPTAVFSIPPIASVGLTESEAKSKFENCHVYETRFKPLSNALSGKAAPVYMKVITEGKSERLVGIHVAGDSADEMIQILGILLVGKLTKKEMDATCAVHPTIAEELVTLSKRKPD